MPNPNYSTPWRGDIVLQCTASSGAQTVGTQIVIPAAMAYTDNPDNKVSPDVVNASSYTSVEALGIKTPSFKIIAYAKASWFTALNLNSFLFNLNSLYSTDTYACLFDDKFLGRVYDGAKCVSVQAYQTAEGGPITVTMDWLALYGDSEKPGGATTFTGVSTDPGQLLNVTQTNWGSGTPTADQVMQWSLQMMRVQRYVPYFNGTQYMADIASGGFGGVLALTQGSTYNYAPSTAATLNIGQAGAGVSLSLLLSRLGKNQPQNTDLGRRVIAYGLKDLSAGGNPVTITAQ